MKIQNPETKEKLIQRLRRIEGQAHGIQNMLEEERDCQEIVQQLTAIRSAVQGASRYFLREYVTACLAKIDEPIPGEAAVDSRKKREEVIQNMISLLDKAP